MIIGIIEISNCIGTILNGQTQIVNTKRRIHSSLLPTSFTSKMEKNCVICFDIKNLNQLTMMRYSSVKNLVLLLHQLESRLQFRKNKTMLIMRFPQTQHIHIYKNTFILSRNMMVKLNGGESTRLLLIYILQQAITSLINIFNSVK